MEKVVLERCDNYDPNLIKSLLDSMFYQMSFVPPRGSKVLIKPNLLAARTAEQAVTTHPSVIAAVAGLFLDYSCDVFVGDSPGFGSTERVLKWCGILDVVRKMDLTISHFNSKYLKRIEDGVSPYREFLLGEDPERYEIIVNLPKLKTHAMMGLTLGVKNTFGFVHALEKAKWHLRAGRDRHMFASMLVDIHTIVHPTLTVLDGIIGMDGDGPSSGRPRTFGLLASSANAFALDDSVEKVVGFPGSTPIAQIARRYGLMPQYELTGTFTHIVNDLMLPTSMRTDWTMPDFARKMFRSAFTKKPKVRKMHCKSCTVCVQVCPAGALRMDDNHPVFDYERCIRCYCCQELCPQKAIFVR